MYEAACDAFKFFEDDVVHCQSTERERFKRLADKGYVQGGPRDFRAELVLRVVYSSISGSGLLAIR